ARDVPRSGHVLPIYSLCTDEKIVTYMPPPSHLGFQAATTCQVSPFTTALHRNAHLTLFPSNLSPKRDCSSKGVRVRQQFRSVYLRIVLKNICSGFWFLCFSSPTYPESSGLFGRG
ncbi:unnamed protein product, partial [Laminaria digitata]